MQHVCVHCRNRTAGFWVFNRGCSPGGVRRPWCLTCIDTDLDRAKVDIIPIGEDRDR